MRLRSIRMKEGGATIRVLNTPQTDDLDGKPENWRGKLITHAKSIANMDTPTSKLDGYIVIGMFSDGSSSTAFRINERIPSCLAPAYVAELLRRDAVTGREAVRVFDSKFEWVE